MALAIISASGIFAFAITPTNTNADLEGVCKSGPSEFISFITALISFEDFDGYFKDLTMNGCQYTEVSNLRKKLKSIREDLRESFYNCATTQIAKSKKEFYATQANLYFVRNLVLTKKNTRIANPLPVLKDKMKERFVKKLKYFNEDEVTETKDSFEVVFAALSAKYDAKDFVECKEDVELLVDYVKGLKSTIDGIVGELKGETEDEFKAVISNFPNASKEEGKARAESQIDIANKGVDIQRGVDQIINDLEEIGGKSSLSILSEIENEEVRYSMDKKKAKAISRFKAKYQFVGDSITQDYANRVAIINETIRSSTQSIGAVKSCLNYATETQCSD